MMSAADLLLRRACGWERTSTCGRCSGFSESAETLAKLLLTVRRTVGNETKFEPERAVIFPNER
jgi:hypothetical protein